MSQNQNLSLFANNIAAANSTGLYYTGTINAASHTVGSSTVANSTGVYTGVVNGSSISVGTSTIANSTGVYTGVVNATSYNTGGGYGSATGGIVANSSSIAVGNTTSNVIITSNTVSVYGSNVGYLEVPQNSQSTAYTTVLSDNGKHIFHPSSDNNARTFTIANNSSVAYPIGTILTFVNMANVLTIAINNDTMYLSSNGATGSRTVNTYGTASALKVGSTTWLISGSNIT